MGKGSSGSSTTVQNTAPPQQFMDAYTHAVQNAQNVASQPFQQYQGNLQAPLSPDQQAAIGNIQSAQGITAPYINSAADYINNSTAPLQPTLQPYQAAQSWWGTQAGLNAQNLPNLENQFFACEPAAASTGAGYRWSGKPGLSTGSCDSAAAATSAACEPAGAASGAWTCWEFISEQCGRAAPASRHSHAGGWTSEPNISEHRQHAGPARATVPWRQ
jgi:hypothetical protein